LKLTRKYWLIILITPVMVALDQVTKAFIHSALTPYVTTVTLIPDYLNIIHVQNTGMAFSLFTGRFGGYGIWVFPLITLFALGIIVYLFSRAQDDAIILPAALSFVLAGALGNNLIDRLHWGYVVDFIQMGYGGHYWPIYNVADISITIGIVLLILDSFRPQPKLGPEPKPVEQVPLGGAGES